MSGGGGGYERRGGGGGGGGGGENGELPPSSPLGPNATQQQERGFPFPRSPPATAGSMATAGERATNNVNDFITGYTLGLIGGVRSWMTKSRRASREEESRQASDEDSEESEEKASGERRREEGQQRELATSQRG
ncbi:hypothetical protein VTI74DRAFT_2057 [Chaetomium olivicolor]